MNYPSLPNHAKHTTNHPAPPPHQLQAELEELDIVGAVDVSRTTNVDGYTWLVTFNGCRTVGMTDVCNIGDLPTMTFYNNLTGGNGPSIEVTEVVTGSGPGDCDGADGLCHDTVTDLSGGAPYTYDITQLTTGTPYYVRVSAHTAMSYGRRTLTTPEFELPANTQPGKNTPVRLVSSTRTSIELEWDYPTQVGVTHSTPRPSRAPPRYGHAATRASATAHPTLALTPPPPPSRPTRRTAALR